VLVVEVIARDVPVTFERFGTTEGSGEALAKEIRAAGGKALFVRTA
jgi:hypothetical protein